MSTRFFNIKSLKFDNVTYTTVDDVTIGTTHKMLEDSGDDDIYASFLAQGPAGATKISVSLKDPVQARQLKGAASGTLTFIGQTEDGGTEMTVTVNGCKFFSHDHNAKHGAIHTQKVNGAAAVDGQTDPVSYG